MTRQIENVHSLVGSSTGNRSFRVNALAAAVVLMIGGALTGLGQQPQSVQSESAKPSTEKKPAVDPKETMARCTPVLNWAVSLRKKTAVAQCGRRW